jgi:hypothetical protein
MHRHRLIFHLIVFLLYLLLPTVNHSVDAWGFAADAKFGHELFRPHHLLYTATIWLFGRLLPFLNIMQAALCLNALAGAGSVWVLGKILQNMGLQSRESIALQAVMAFSWATWRYATENETYILPVLFSLSATWFLVHALQNKRPAEFLLSGFLAALACLFHQLHFLWWLGLLIFLIIRKDDKKLLRLFYWASPAVLVPFCYLIVTQYYFHLSLNMHSILHFIFYDYYAGNAGQAFEMKFLWLGMVNLFRTFFQMHGSILFLLSHYKVMWAIPLLALLFLGTGIGRYWRIICRIKVFRKQRFLLFLLLFLAYFAFAVYSGGNAEFMVMLPPLLCLVLGCCQPLPLPIIRYSAGALLIWNLGLAVIPNHFLKQNSNEEIASLVQEHPEAFFIPSDPGIVGNIVEYRTGSQPANLLRSTGWYEAHGKNPEGIFNQTDSLLKMEIPLYADNPPALLNRKALVQENSLQFLESRYNVHPWKKFPTVYGIHAVYKVEGRK